MYVAHKRDDGVLQPLKEHSESTAALAGRFAEPFGASAHARRAGLLHDIGKYSRAGQIRMVDHEHAPRVDHSTAGAQEALRQGDAPTAFAVAGHHSGLPDLGNRGDPDSAATLMGRKKKKLTGALDPTAWKSEIEIDGAPYLPAWLDLHDAYAAQFYTRMLFSCLVDADYLDTEAFMRPDAPRRGKSEKVEALLERLHAHVRPWLDDGCASPLNRKRTQILNDCFRSAEQSTGLFSLTVPTGGGKTVSSMAFALAHAVRNGLTRVIYVIPYMSIIEQNAAVFRSILGENSVLEHHSNIDYNDDAQDSEDGRARRMRLASENWDAPVVVTTAVQFFESLYGARTSKCRKLHNIANSVIVFDEAQMLPVPYIKPCVRVIAELVKHYGVSAVLCTATQPALDKLFHAYAPDMQVREICPDAADTCFSRVVFHREPKPLSDEALAKALSQPAQVLCIVNRRVRAQDVCRLLPEEGRFHLSTMLTPKDRRRILDQIRGRLEEGKCCRVVSTSLVEAGVDVDFPEVWREEAGLDSILQAAGRCNREGRRPVRASTVHVFESEGDCLRGIRQNVAAMRYSVEGSSDMDAPETMKRYFEFLYGLKGEELDHRRILDSCSLFKFRTVSEAFHLIGEDTLTVYIPDSDNESMLETLRAEQYSKALFRKLESCAVNVYPQHFRRLVESGSVEPIEGLRCGILTDPYAYTPGWGLAAAPETGQAFMV